MKEMGDIDKKWQDGRFKQNHLIIILNIPYFSSGLPSNRCQNEIRCSRDLLENMLERSEGR